MREIKFRAWDKELKKMEYYGPKFYIDGEYCELNFVPTEEEGDVILSEGTNQRLIAMQYTGLKDKNGKEIYEGDIVEFVDPEGNKEISQVVYGKQNGAFCFDLPHVDAGIRCPILNFIENTMSLVAENNFEIIGNVHENPNLLEGK